MPNPRPAVAASIMSPTEQKHRAFLSDISHQDLWVAKTVEFAFWLAFVGNIGRGVLHNNDLLRRAICRPMVDAAGWILIYQGAKALLEHRHTSSGGRKVHLLTCAVLAIAIFAMAHGVVAGAKLPMWYEMGPMGFGPAFAVFLARRPLVFEAVFRSLSRQIVLADLFVGYLLLHWPNESRFDWYWTANNNEGLGMIANRCFFALPFLIANYRRLSVRQLLLVGIGFAEYLALNLKAENRSAVLIAFAVIPVLVLAITLRQRISIAKLWKAALCASILTAVLVHAASDNAGFQKVMQRFGVADLSTAGASGVASGMDQTIWANFAGNGPRGEEFRELLSDTSFEQFLFGRGFGVSWYCPLYATITPEWYIVHFGPGYMILVGGLPLSICFTALLVVALWKAWINVNRFPSAAGALVFLGASAINYLQHGILLNEPEFYLFWMCIGFSVGVPRCLSAKLASGRAAPNREPLAAQPV